MAQTKAQLVDYGTAVASSVPTNGPYLSAANTVAISTNGSGRLFVNSSGSVGIGTSSVASTLHIVDSSFAGNGTIRLGGGGGYPGFYSIISSDSFSNGKLFFNSAASSGTSHGHQFQVDGTAAVTIDASRRVGIGTTNPGGYSGQLVVNISPSGDHLVFSDDATSSGAAAARLGCSGNNLVFKTNSGASAATERARIDSSGRLLVGTSSAVGTTSGTGLIVRSPVSNNFAGEILLQNAYTRPGNGSAVGSIKFQDAEGSTYSQIIGFQDGTASSSSDVPGGLTFSTTADGASSPTERMRIDSSGRCMINTNIGYGALAMTVNSTNVGTATNAGIWVNVTSTSYKFAQFEINGAPVGSITTTGSATAYNTSSDYRLKENVAAVADGITRLQQLKPSRFNFKVDPERTVDGFIAHEVQEVVPEAITGEKDAVDADGNPIYQGIDQSKLVPLLTAALQELVAEVESLKAEVAALKAA